MAYLEFNNVALTYDPKAGPILEDFQLQIGATEFVSLVGKSGCGKTSLLKLAAGLLQPSDGQVTLDGKAIEQPHDDVGVVFQTPTLLEWLTVRDNVLLPISLQRTIRSTDITEADNLLELVGLSEFSEHYPLTLSGGQQSRVAIARAIIQKPVLLLLDEPFAALDALTREALQDDLLNLCELSGMTVLFITHDISEAVYLSDRVIVMRDGQSFLDLSVSLSKPRDMSVRFGAEFNRLCLTARTAMMEPIT